MAAFVLGENLEAGSDGETNQGNERIPESNAVDVVAAGEVDERASLFVAREKSRENRRRHAAARDNAPRRAGALRVGRRLDVRANEPPAEPTRRDFRHR